MWSTLRALDEKKVKVKLVPHGGQKSALIEVTHREEPYVEDQTESCIERFLTYITVLLVQYLNTNIRFHRLLILSRKYTVARESREIRNSQHTIQRSHGSISTVIIE